MKKNLRLDYTLVAEGYAEYSFIPTYLRLMALQFGVQVVPSKLGFKGEKAGKSKVLKEAKAIFTTAIGQGHQLLIVGVDLDEADHEKEQPKHTAECKSLLNSLGKVHENYGNRIIHFVSVQAIEQWMAYQSYRVNIGEKCAPNSLESKSQHELKRRLYGERDNGLVMERVSDKIASAADFDELAKQSRSFAHFHNQVITFLDQYNKTQSI
ncbi:hypothetical protein ACFSUS_12360 [Spirosoma soli]|uniref:DUF4276 family protein n=1 Tax=Spirosoma soli TaxID=1770529 RepID=A0ABW5M396_9BACT